MEIKKTTATIIQGLSSAVGRLFGADAKQKNPGPPELSLVGRNHGFDRYAIAVLLTRGNSPEAQAVLDQFEKRPRRRPKLKVV